MIEWPDFSRIRNSDVRDRHLLDFTIAVIEARDRDGRVADFFATKPGSPKETDHLFVEECEDALVGRIVFDLRPPKRRKLGDPARERDRAVDELDRIICAGGPLKEKLKKALKGRRASRRRATYDRIVLGGLLHLADYIRAEWREGNFERWGNMPTPEEVAVEYFLTVQNVSNGAVREACITELEAFSSRPRLPEGFALAPAQS